MTIICPLEVSFLRPCHTSGEILWQNNEYACRDNVLRQCFASSSILVNFDKQICAVDQQQAVLIVVTFEETESHRVENREGYRSLLAVLHYPLSTSTAPQKRNRLQTVMRQKSKVQILLLNKLCERDVPLATEHANLGCSNFPKPTI